MSGRAARRAKARKRQTKAWAEAIRRWFRKGDYVAVVGCTLEIKRGRIFGPLTPDDQIVYANPK